LAARVRRDGFVISHTSRAVLADFNVAAAALSAAGPATAVAASHTGRRIPPEAAQASEPVAQAGFHAPATRRLPLVEPLAE
jgi:hypothetical protein